MFIALKNKIQAHAHLKGIFLSLICFFFFSLMNAVNRLALSQKQMEFVHYFGLVKLVSFVIMLSFGYFAFGKNYFWVGKPKIVAIRSVILVINTIVNTLAVTYLPLDIYYSIVFIMPILAVVLGMIFLGETFEWIKFLLIVLGFVGVLIALQPVFTINFGYLGAIYAFLAALTGASSGIIARKYLQMENAFSITFYPLTLAMLVGGLMSFKEINTPFFFSGYSVFILIVLAALGQLLGSVFYAKAYQTAPAKYVAPMQYTQIFWGGLFGFVLFNEPPVWTSLLGTALVVLASVLMSWKEK